MFPPRKIGNCWKRNGRETTPEWQWKIFFCKKIAKSKRSREHLALAHKLNENNKSIVGTSESDKTPKFIIEGCRIVDLKYVQEQMTGGCSACQKTLKLDNTEVTKSQRNRRRQRRLQTFQKNFTFEAWKNNVK